MGNDNSSKTRIQSLMTDYVNDDNDRFTQLLNLICHGYRKDSWANQFIGNIQAIYFEGSELKAKSLSPTTERLIWLVENLKEANGNRALPENKTTKRRQELISGEKRTVIEAKNNIIGYDVSKGFPHKWWVLEGSSQPDIFILTDKYIFLCEVKYAEESLTISTNLDVDRVQLVRQIEGAMKFEKDNQHQGNEREVISFYILSKVFLDKNENQVALDNSMNGDVTMWDNSLKHLSHQSIEEIKQTYLGYTTWEDITEKLGFSFRDEC